MSSSDQQGEGWNQKPLSLPGTVLGSKLLIEFTLGLLAAATVMFRKQI